MVRHIRVLVHPHKVADRRDDKEEVLPSTDSGHRAEVLPSDMEAGHAHGAAVGPIAVRVGSQRHVVKDSDPSYVPAVWKGHADSNSQHAVEDIHKAEACLQKH